MQEQQYSLLTEGREEGREGGEREEGGREGGREVRYYAIFYITVPLTTRNTLTRVSLQWYLAASNFCKM